jgi:hypothetical protein
MLSLVTLSIRRRRDALFARQRARQIAGLFHFELQDQAFIAAGTFAIASQILRHAQSGAICIALDNDVLHIFPRASVKGRATSPQLPENSWRLVKALPAAADYAAEDLVWLCKQLNEEGSRVFEEIERQNQEMLVLLHALQVANSRLAGDLGDQRIPSAA